MIRAALIALAIVGCGGTPLSNATRIYGAARAAHDRAVPIMASAIGDDLHAQCAQSDDVDACVHDRAQRWQTTGSAINAAAATFDATAAALLRWAERDPDGPYPPGACEAIRDTLDAVRGYVALMTALGVELPIVGGLELRCE